MRWLCPPQIEVSRARDPFDPVVEGARHGLSRELSLAIWVRVCGQAADRASPLDRHQAELRFREIAARGGRWLPDVGRLTRVATEIGGEPVNLRAITAPAPGRSPQLGDAASAPLCLDDHRVLGLQHVLHRLGVDHPVRPQLLAAASVMERTIAGRATRWCEPLGGEATARGHVLWNASERHAAMLYRRAAHRGLTDEHDPVVETALQQRGTGQPLSEQLRRTMEGELGVSLAGVRIHTDLVASHAARALDAEAFTVGEDIFFAEAMFAPDTRAGQKLLTHELAHVAQALRGDVPPLGDAPRVSEPGDKSEREAEAVAERIDRTSVLRRVAATAGAGPAATSIRRHDEHRLAALFAPPGSRRGAVGGVPITQHPGDLLQRDKKGAAATGPKQLSPGDKVVAMQILGSTLQVTFQRSGTFSYTILQSSLAPRPEPYHGTAKGIGPGVNFRVTDAVGDVVVTFQGTDREPAPAAFRYADRFPITVEEGANVSPGVPTAGVTGGVGGGQHGTRTGTGAQAQVVDAKQVEALKQRGLLPADQADPIARRLAHGEGLTFEQALMLGDALEHAAGPGRGAAGDHDRWLQWARFLEKNKSRITANLKVGSDGKAIDQTRAVLDEYKQLIGVTDPPTTTFQAKIEDARQRDPRVAAAWNALSPHEKALWTAYLKDHGSTRTTTEPRTDLHPTGDDKLMMALTIAVEYMPEGAAAQLRTLVNDPIFWASLSAGLTAYLILWMAPEPIFTKAAAILTTITILSVTGFAASQIIAVARAYVRLRDACAAATSLDEIRAAAREFGHTIGATGTNVLVTVAMLLGGKALPARPPGGPMLMPEPVPVPAGGPPMPVPAPAAAGAAVATPGYAIAIGANGEIIYLSAKADAAAGGGGGRREAPSEASEAKPSNKPDDPRTAEEAAKDPREVKRYEKPKNRQYKSFEDWWNAKGKKWHPNPDGAKGNADHQATVDRLEEMAGREFPGDYVHKGDSINGMKTPSGREIVNVKRNPDVWVEDAQHPRVVKKVYEAARTNESDDSFVVREMAKKKQYDALGLKSHFEPVRPDPAATLAEGSGADVDPGDGD